MLKTLVENAGSPLTAWIMLLALLILAGPQFVCMPLTNDVAYYDLQAKLLLDGGVLYRDMVEPNLPGAVWIHAGVRSLMGWSSEAIRCFDLTVFGAIVALLGIGMGDGRQIRNLGWFAVAALLFYVSISEWSHVQRDTWLLLPVSAALWLRARQIRRCRTGASGWKSCLGWAAIEGACWGCAVWIKPHVLIPATGVWLLSAFALWNARKVSFDFGGLLIGGLAVGLAGVGWMLATGTWSYFMDMMLVWNSEYLADRQQYWAIEHVAHMAYRLFPWILLHLIAAPLAMQSIANWTVTRTGWRQRPQDPLPDVPPLLSMCYLAWLVQSVGLQYPHDYVQVPLILLALAQTVESLYQGRRVGPVRRLAVCGFLALAVAGSPVKSPTRIAGWMNFIREGSTPKNRDMLAQMPYPGWRDLDAVAAYLRSRDVRDSELTCFNNDLIHLYNELDADPSTRYVYLSTCLSMFPSHAEQIMRTTASSRQRFVVSNLMSAGLSRPQALVVGESGPLSLPPAFPTELSHTFPWSLPMVFRSGTLIVHEVPQSAEPVDDHMPEGNISYQYASADRGAVSSL